MEESYHHPNLREELIEAGIRIMNEQGTAQLSLRKIAMACGVSHTAPYRHFADKEDLLKAMQKHVEERLSAILEQAVVDSRKAEHPMIEFGKAYVRFFCGNPQYYQFFIMHIDDYFKINAQISEIKSDYRPFVIFQTEAVAHFKKFQLPTQYHQSIILSMWATVHGLAAMAVMNNVVYDGHWEDLTEKVLIGGAMYEQNNDNT